MKRILLSLVMIVLASSTAVGATRAYYFDNETSNGNQFTAGSLDLNVDAADEIVIKFTVTNMHVGSQNIGTWRLRNVGSLLGYLDLQNIVVTSSENGINDPEDEAGDTTVDVGELQDQVSLSKLFWDNDCDGWVGTGETSVYDGKVGSIASNYETNKALAAGAEQCLTGQFNWWNNGASDNLAQGDSFTLDMTFELGQTTAQ